ncbi:hypothetical protein [Brachybacterium phenoliresistens]|uniref:variant leucine-rich repeat-containing protein n=1 Tax=Brachybacterium phenoliresistens TaxID=396014 RepID=UPI0031D20718
MVAQGDRERYIAGDPRTSPQELADLAGRRWDLHAVIAANPRTHPALRRWIASVNPHGMARPPAAPAAPRRYGRPPAGFPPPGRPPLAPRTPPRRGGIGGCLAGCGCSTLVLVLVAMVILGAGALLSPDGSDRPAAGGNHPSPSGGSGDPAVDEQLAIFDAERERYYELVAELEGNPAAPLVTLPGQYARLEDRAASVGTNEFSAQTVAQEAQRRREDLEQHVDAAADRAANSSGSLSEGLVDEAGDGLIDIRWDADAVCAQSEREGWTTFGCVLGADALTVHLQPEDSFTGEWDIQMTVQHELAHVYQRADRARFDDGSSEYDELLEQGLFQGSVELMADCYALTYYDEWTLETDSVEVGYGYVCDESERDAIREWSASIDAPMPG